MIIWVVTVIRAFLGLFPFIYVVRVTGASGLELSRIAVFSRLSALSRFLGSLRLLRILRIVTVVRVIAFIEDIAVFRVGKGE
jgi:hypothetical protein